MDLVEIQLEVDVKRLVVTLRLRLGQGHDNGPGVLESIRSHQYLKRNVVLSIFLKQRMLLCFDRVSSESIQNFLVLATI